jgi:hypothetical protein
MGEDETQNVPVATIVQCRYQLGKGTSTRCSDVPLQTRKDFEVGMNSQEIVIEWKYTNRSKSFELESGTNKRHPDTSYGVHQHRL